MLDYHSFKTEVKKHIIQRWQGIDILADPLCWAWMVYALSGEGVSNNPLVVQALDQAKRWIVSDEAWNADGQLAGIGLLCSTLRDVDDTICVASSARLAERVSTLRERGLSKFSRLNDPDFILAVALGAGKEFPAELCDWLRKHCESNAQPGNWRRSLMFAAATSELSGRVAPFPINGGDLQIHELFPALWFSEQYPALIDGDHRRRGLWEAFERVQDVISWDDDDDQSPFVASPIDMAMLYVALVRQTRQIDPVVLFNNFPWHPDTRSASESLFVKG